MDTQDLELPANALGTVAAGDDATVKPFRSRGELYRWRIFVSVGLLTPVAGTVAAIVRTCRVGFVATDFIAFVTMYLLAGFGFTVGYNRLFTHRSFVAARWVELTLAVLGSMTLIGPVSIFVATHRRHHAFTDREADPHSPHAPHRAPAKSLFGRLASFVHGYVAWLFTPEYSPLERWAPDMLADPGLTAVNRHFMKLAFISIFGPALVVFAVTHTLDAFVGALLWGGFARIFCGLNAIFFINSFCHTLGRRPFVSRDRSTNLWPTALITLGESWHNNHHAYPSAASLHFDRWQIDLTGAFIRMLELCGLARDVKRPSAQALARKRAAVAPG